MHSELSTLTLGLGILRRGRRQRRFQVDGSEPNSKPVTSGLGFRVQGSGVRVGLEV